VLVIISHDCMDLNESQIWASPFLIGTIDLQIRSSCLGMEYW
jgi:hypothetical protein